MAEVKGKIKEKLHSGDEAATVALAARLAGAAKPGDIFTLEGPLGAGKSVFARAFIRHLCGADTDVPSPTFTLVQQYDAPLAPIYHFDLYRLEDPDEIFELGWDDALYEGICLIEWSSKAGTHMPAHRTHITIDPVSDSKREVTIHEL